MSTGSFEFFSDYERTVYELQPELYGEIRSVLGSELRGFAERTRRRPKVLDVGSAGVVPFEPELTESTTILDLFPKPPALELKKGVVWRVGDILEADPSEDGQWDVVLMSSVLHHLADRHNNAVANVKRAFRNVSARLRDDGALVIFESVCPSALALAQDLLYPLYSRALVRLVGFTYVRMLSLNEVLTALGEAGFRVEELPFRQPRYIAQMRWRVPSKYYPLRVHSLKGTKSTRP